MSQSNTNQQTSSVDALKAAFDRGYAAFQTVVKNDRGFWNTEANPYSKTALMHKEWERGMNRAFWEQQTKIEREQNMAKKEI